MLLAQRLPQEVARHALVEDEAGRIMVSPEGGPTRDRRSGAINGSSGRSVGLADSYPADSSPWLVRAPPIRSRFGDASSNVVKPERRMSEMIRSCCHAV
jgi:hypothetical protein